jgi:hypothetical protein
MAEIGRFNFGIGFYGAHISVPLERRPTVNTPTQETILKCVDSACLLDLSKHPRTGKSCGAQYSDDPFPRPAPIWVYSGPA